MTRHTFEQQLVDIRERLSENDAHRLSLEEKHKRPVFQRISDTFSAVLRGQLLTGLTQALVAGVLFEIIRIPLALFFATLTFITAMIPVVGASAVWVPLVIYLAITKQFAKAAILFIFGTLVISLIDNIMKPALIGEIRSLTPGSAGCPLGGRT